jgi:hypothetical protein
MSLIKNGVSTTTGKDQFNFEVFTTKIGRKPITRIQWDYRDSNGVLHSGVAKTILDAAKAAEKFGYKIKDRAVSNK